MSEETVVHPLNRFPRMMQEYLTRRLREKYCANHERVMGLRTREEALSYRAEVRQKVDRIFGPWPERTPLKLRVTGEIESDAYRVRKLLFDSRPGFTVSALLYVPRGRTGKCPAVLCPCGHSWDAKYSVAELRLHIILIFILILILIKRRSGRLDALRRLRLGLGSRLGLGDMCNRIYETEY